MQLIHAPTGGLDEFGRRFKGGEFLPFYVPREAMPQMDAIDQPKLVRDALAAGIGVSFEVEKVDELHAHQRIIKARALSMPVEVARKPIITSADRYTLDGNHRWFNHVLLKEPVINSIRLAMPFDEAIPWLLALPYVYTLKPDTPIRN
jgi:hypothetical protein